MISQRYLKGYLIGKVSEPNSVFEQCILLIHLTEELLNFVDFLINSFLSLNLTRASCHLFTLTVNFIVTPKIRGNCVKSFYSSEYN